MLKQALAVAVVGLLVAGPASAHDSNWGQRYAPPAHYYPHRYYPYPHYAYYPYRYAPIRYAPRYCPPGRAWGWNGGYYGQYPGRYDRNQWHGNDRYDGRDRDDRHNDWDRHH